MKNVLIFGIKLSKTSQLEVIRNIKNWINGSSQHYVVTPNPEFLLYAGKDEEFFYILNQADISIPDGIGLKFASWAMLENINRITGADLVPEILDIAKSKNKKIALVNWNKGLSTSDEISKGLDRIYPNLDYRIFGTESKSKVDDETINKIKEYKPDIIFTTFGFPFQEKFIYHNLKKIPSAKFAMGVGASFDYISGKTRRAPKIFRVLGLEWVWRLALILFLKNKDGSVYKSKRSKRIFDAVFKFTLRFLKWRFILPYLYRPNVASLLYKKERIRRAPANGAHSNEEIRYKIFVVKRSTEENHWQLPQGGIDRGEDVLEAGMRELREESGTNNFQAIKTYRNIWKYTFDKELGKYMEKRHVGYKGQKQSLMIAEFTGKDEDIKINFWDHDGWMWVDADKLVDKIFYMRKESTKLYLQKFKETMKYE